MRSCRSLILIFHFTVVSCGSWTLRTCFAVRSCRSSILIFHFTVVSCGSWTLRICFAVRSCRSWILIFHFPVVSCGSWTFEDLFCRQILQILDLEISVCRRILWILDPIFWPRHKSAQDRSGAGNAAGARCCAAGSASCAGSEMDLIMDRKVGLDSKFQPYLSVHLRSCTDWTRNRKGGTIQFI